jgi:hypothetical protein
MQKNTARMRLHRETLRRLEEGELAGAPGGTSWTGECCVSMHKTACPDTVTIAD